MLTRRLLVTLFLAISISGLLTFWLSKRVNHARGAAPATKLYIATTHDLEAGDILKDTDLKTISWPTSAPLTGAFEKQQLVEGRAVLFPLAAGQPILDRQLAAQGEGAGLSPRIPEGMRALSLKSDQVVGVAGFLLPGTHVDVLVTLHPNPTDEPVTSTVLQNVRILAAGQKMQPDPDGKATTVDVVTLLVSPEQAERAVMASAQGNIHFVLRNGADHAEPVDEPVLLSSLGGSPLVPPRLARLKRAPSRASGPAAPPAARHYSVDVVLGDKQTTESF